jgi:HlyD family secretion protein
VVRALSISFYAAGFAAFMRGDVHAALQRLTVINVACRRLPRDAGCCTAQERCAEGMVMKVGRKTAVAAAVVVLVVAAAGYLVWQRTAGDALPEGIVSTNGRIEANQVDVATKLAGRVVEIVPHEGDMVDAGSVVARLDAAEIEAQLAQAQAEAQRARQALAAARAVVVSRNADLTFARQQFDRAKTLVASGFTPREQLDERQQQITVAEAALNAANAEVDAANAAVAAADAQVDRIDTLLDDTVVRSPIRGRVQYRLVEPGSVLAAGGRIVTLLDLADVYMTIFLPAGEAGRLAIGDEARIVVDVAPQYVFPVKVSFVAAEAQFTPKTVETSSEREKLMFRVKLQAPPELLKEFEDRVKSGLRGVAYVRTDPAVAWPERLAPKLPS